MADPDKIVELPLLKTLSVRCTSSRCSGKSRATGRLIGWQNFPDHRTWYLECYCAKCRTKETMQSRKIDAFADSVTRYPDRADEFTRGFVEDVRARGWS